MQLLVNLHVPVNPVSTADYPALKSATKNSNRSNSEASIMEKKLFKLMFDIL